jgi:hypothetical protein
MAYRNGTFKDWTQWAQMAQHEYPVYAQLAAERPMITAYNMAISDAAHPPVIHEILRKDGRILVHASDEIMVARRGSSWKWEKPSGRGRTGGNTSRRPRSKGCGSRSPSGISRGIRSAWS